jgi:hypothetical protein
MSSSDPIDSFIIVLNDVINCDPDGNGSATFSQNDFIIPPNTIGGPPTTVSQLINFVGESNISIDYYAIYSGQVSQHDCNCDYTLYAQAIFSGTTGSKVPLFTAPKDAQTYSSTEIRIVSNSKQSIIRLDSSMGKEGGGCGCKFQSYGGFDNITISLKTVVTVQMINFCTTGDNIHYDMCYNYMGNYLSNANYGPTQEISDYMLGYCSRNYPDGTLNMWGEPENMDPKDYQICACNMPPDQYSTFYSDVLEEIPTLAFGSIATQCLFPPCVTSPFKGIGLNGCPVPQCLNIIDFDDVTINGDLSAEQQQECNELGIPTGGSSTPPSGNNPNDNNNDNNNNDNNDNNNTNYIWWALGLLLIIIIIVVLILAIYFMMKKKKKVELY